MDADRHGRGTASAAADNECAMFAKRNRLLLYLRGMELGALPGMELATKSLTRAGPGAEMAEVFDVMHALLREQGIEFSFSDGEGEGLRSFPPHNRRPMLSEGLSKVSLLETVRKIASGLFGFVTLRNILWNRRRRT